MLNLFDMDAGGQLGRDKTIEKICSRFFWKNMTDDIKEYVRRCDKCQRMNAKFHKSNAKLHPVVVHPAVWNQVSISISTVELIATSTCYHCHFHLLSD